MKKFEVIMKGGWDGEVDEWVIKGENIKECCRRVYEKLDCVEMFEEDFELIEEKKKGYWIWDNGGDDIIEIWELNEKILDEIGYYCEGGEIIVGGNEKERRYVYRKLKEGNLRWERRWEGKDIVGNDCFELKILSLKEINLLV